MAYKHLLVPFDGSPLSREALSLGAWLAWRSGAELDLVRAISPVHVPTRNGAGLPLVQGPAVRLARAKSALSMQAAQLREKGLRATGSVFSGGAAPVLLDYIERFGIDLVVMGTHGRPLAERLLLGGVASEVARRSQAPVLLVPRDAQPTHDDAVKLLVAMDDSELARGALDAAVQLADGIPAEITLFQVLPGATPLAEQRTEAWYEAPLLAGGEYLDEAQATLAKRGLNVRRAYSCGVAAEEILRYAQDGNFDMVAVGTRGLTGVPRLLWGSVSEYVVRNAHIPVLVTSPCTARTGQRTLLEASALT